jgi:hypothetical protein
MADLLPEGDVWDWPEGGFGDGLLTGTAQELVRVEDGAQQVLDEAIEIHRPKVGSWHIDEYRRIAAEAIVGVSETQPRKALAAGFKVGARCWSSAAPITYFPVDLVQIKHLVGPLRAGFRAGDRCWGSRGRYVLQVRYYRSVVDPKALWDALMAFKQAHVFLWFEDITGVGGHYGQN